MSTSSKSLPEPAEVLFEQISHWSKWLSGNYESYTGIWMVFAKKNSKKQSVSYLEALEVALCYGWIDGTRKRHTEETFLQKFTPRRPKSIWSKINKARALQLIKSKRMKPAGLAAIQTAKKNGQWQSAYDSPKSAKIPPDFQAALDANPKAKAFFETLSGSNRYSFLFRIQTAKKPETRAKRIRQFIGMLAKKQKFHP